ncbi:hypothetical protein [Streptomyces chilikensis]|uniref:Uncharacterized protein n=1 Tax=Streptomyces chilikensis TaxID=1194079 RepID=A0ABV3EU12_9ACTN
MTDDTTGPAGRDGEPPRTVYHRVFSHGGPAPAPVCPSCDHSGPHHPGCDLRVLSVEEASLLGYEEALRHARSLVGSDALDTGAPPPVARCPSCDHSGRHHPGCELRVLSVEEASLLGYEEACRRARSLVESGGPVTGAPPPVARCPSCDHSGTHHPGCELGVLSVEDASLLGYEEALRRARSLLEGAVSWGAPPPARQCPGCHHSADHGPGCDLAALPVGDAALLGYQEALRRVRHLGEPVARSAEAPRQPEEGPGSTVPVDSVPVDSVPVDGAPVAGGPPSTAPPPSGGIRARLRRLLRR